MTDLNEPMDPPASEEDLPQLTPMDLAYLEAYEELKNSEDSQKLWGEMTTHPNLALQVIDGLLKGGRYAEAVSCALYVYACSSSLTKPEQEEPVKGHVQLELIDKYGNPIS